MKITRRNFIKASGITAALYPLSSSAENYFMPIDNQNQSEQPVITEVPTICRACKAKCLMLAQTNGSKLKQLTGNPKDPFSKGKLCAKGFASIKTLYDPNRLKSPLKSIGERGKGEWRKISWGEAIDTIAFNLEKVIKKHGPESVGLFANDQSANFIIELFNQLNITNIVNASNDYVIKNNMSAYRATYGNALLAKNSEVLKESKCIVMIGNHLGENINLKQINYLSTAIDSGAKIIVIDPRMSAIAAKADLHLMIRPGTDTAFLLGLINYICTKKSYDKEFIDNYTIGLDSLSEKYAYYSVDIVSKITDLPVDQLQKCFELIISSAPDVVINSGNFNAWYGNDTQRLRAVEIVNVLLSSKATFSKYFINKSPNQKNISDSNKYKLTSTSLIKRTLKGEVKILGCWGQNPFQAIPNPYRTSAAFKKADFTFCCDIYPSETALHADIILPEATFLERMDYPEIKDGYDQEYVVLNFPVVKPMFEAKDSYSIVKELSVRLRNGKKNFGFESIWNRIDHDLAEKQLTINQIKKNKGIISSQKNAAPVKEDLKFQTPSGKIEFFSESLLEKGHSPIPEFKSVLLPPKGFVRLLNGRSPVHTGWSHNNSWLNKEISENELWLNDKIAVLLKINSGDRFFMENQDGIRSINQVKIKVTPGIRVDCVFLAHGFGCKSLFLNEAFGKGVADGPMMTRGIPDELTGVRGMRINFIRLVRRGRSIDIPQLDSPPDMLRQQSRWWFDSFGSYEKGEVRQKYV